MGEKMNNREQAEPQTKKPVQRRRLKKGCRRSLIGFGILLVVLAVAVGWIFKSFRYNYRRITGDPAELGFENIIDEKIINIALFGLDTRSVDCFEGNSDSIMILSVNTETKQIKIISIMRDSLVPIKYKGKTVYAKINSAYQRGGPQLAIQTLNQCFGLDISEYATVNFCGMADIIEAVGGIEATITEDELKNKGKKKPNINGCMDEICASLGLNAEEYYIDAPGRQHLNGVQAVAYSRVRYYKSVWGTNNDFGRTDRQRYVMEQLFEKVKGLEKSKYIPLAKSLIPCTETSLSYNEIMGVAYNVMFSSPTFSQMRVPQSSGDMNFLMDPPSGSFGSVIYYDLDYVKRLIHAVLYEDMTLEAFVEENGIDKNDWYAERRRS